MFGNLIESGSHTRDIKRRSSFFLGAMIFYVVLLSVAGVASIYAYDARLKDEQEWLLVSMLKFAPATTTAIVPPAGEPPRREQPAANSNAGRNNVTMRTKIVINAPVVPSRTVADDDNTPEVAPNGFVVIGTENRNPIGAGIPVGAEGTGDGRPSNTGTTSVSVPVDNVEPPPAPKQSPPPQQTRPKVLALSTVISSKIIEKPVPVYPVVAKATRTQGPVTVQILVDEAGKVISAQATTGPPLLTVEAVRAAYRARFTPTMLNGQPVKVSGIITYNFVLQ